MSSEQGIASVETALVMPLILLLLLGMVQIALVYRAQIQLDYACFCGARAALVKTEEKDWLEQAREKAQGVLGRQADFELSYAQDPHAIRVGTPMTFHLAWQFPTLFYFRPSVALKSQCTLTSESGPYVAD